MASTNKTTHYNLPLFVGTDKPTWLGDFNSAMQALDTAIYNAEQAATTANSLASSANSLATSAQSSAASALESASSALSAADNIGEFDKIALSAGDYSGANIVGFDGTLFYNKDKSLIELILAATLKADSIPNGNTSVAKWTGGPAPSQNTPIGYIYVSYTNASGAYFKYSYDLYATPQRTISANFAGVTGAVGNISVNAFCFAQIQSYNWN